MVVAAPSTRQTLKVACSSCHHSVELVCAGRPAYQGYQTYNEYICPHCRKKNVARTSGLILSVHPAA